MKKILLSLCTLVTAFSLSSCSEDFDVAAPYKDITVVYGLLDISERVQYIRIQKAFLSQNASALEMAKVADSSFYKNLEVSIREISNTGAVINTQPLVLETLDPKSPGVFFTTPNLAYRYDHVLKADHQYQLIIRNTATGNVDSAITSVVDTAAETRFRINEFRGNFPSINFSQNSQINNYKLTMNTEGNAAYYYEGYIKFKYWTQDAAAGTMKDTTFTWMFASKIQDPGPVNLEVPTAAFFTVFKNNIPDATPTQTRFIDSAEVFVWAADRNYKDYMLANQVQGGITADQIKPNFTTIRGKNVLGLFGSRARRIRRPVPLTDASVDSLETVDITRSLRFVGRKTP